MDQTPTTKKSARPARFLLQMREDLRAALQQFADENNRSLTAEINTRLQVSLAARGPTLQTILARQAFPAKEAAPDATTRLSTAHGEESQHNVTGEGVPGYVNRDELHATDAAMLDIWRALPAEKKLALLSLLR